MSRCENWLPDSQVTPGKYNCAVLVPSPISHPPMEGSHLFLVFAQVYSLYEGSGWLIKINMMNMMNMMKNYEKR